jgi:DNA-binding CsgD family transcriptional regulator
VARIGERQRHRCREQIAAVIQADLDVEEARRAAIAELRRAIGSLARLVALEEQGDVTSKPQLIVGARASVALSAATRGDLARSRRWRECLHPYGIGDEVMTACRDRYGCWGSVELMRDSDDQPFHDEDVRLLDALAPSLGALVRRSFVRRRTGCGFGFDGPRPGTIILDATLSATAWTAPVQDWLGDLASGGMLPPAVYEIGARVLTPPAAAHRLAPTVRVRTRSGRWSVIEGARLEGDVGRVVVTIRAATADEIFDLLCKAHGLTDRERQLVSLSRGGLATTELARTLGISPYTVQDHLKAIFDKTRVRSRRELMSHLTGRLSADHTRGGAPTADPAE